MDGTKFDRDTLNQEKHDNVTDPTSTERAVCASESTKRCVLTPKHVESDQTGTGRPVTVDQKEEHNIDFRVPRLSHSVVKAAEHLRVQELVQRIENHSHRAALQADLQQNNVYNSFSKNSKEMIRELGNVELFELCETTPKVQCSQCILYWNQGIVYCTCGQCLIYSESRENLTNYDWMQSLSRTTSSRKALPMVLDTARPKYKENTTWFGMRGRDAVRTSTPKVNNLQVFTIDFSEIQFIVNNNSQSDGRNKNANSVMNLRKKTIHINPLQRKGEDTKDNGILLQTKQAKMGL